MVLTNKDFFKTFLTVAELKSFHSSLGYMSPVAYRMKKMGQRAG